MRGLLLGAAALCTLAACDSTGPVEMNSGAPVISEIIPASALAGSEVVIRGQNFGEFKEWNDVWIGGLLAKVVRAQQTELRVMVPECLPTRSADVFVTRGALVGNTRAMEVIGNASNPINLQRGQRLTVTDTTALACLRLAPTSDAASYVIIAMNAAPENSARAGFQLNSFGDGAPVAAPAGGVSRRFSAQPDAATAWHAVLRSHEARLVGQPRAAPDTRMTARVSVPTIGEPRSFNVFTRTDRIERVHATLVALGRTVAVYVDVAVANTLSAQDLQPMIRDFDDLMHPVETSLFGVESDLDRNARVAVLLTPAVNRLTPANETSYVAGFFFGCDLLAYIECSATNSGEILYGAAPDPTGKFGVTLSKERVLKNLPSVMAHEFAHLIHFNQRILVSKARELEALWLTEALALMAEDTIGAILYQRGDVDAASEFLFPNRQSAGLYLSAPERTTLVAVEGGGTPEERGAGWLFLRYLQGRFGARALAPMMRSTKIGTVNVAAVTGQSWSALLQDWATALYVAGSSELRALNLPDYGAFDLKLAVSSVTDDGVYPLMPRVATSLDSKFEISLPASGVAYFKFEPPAGTRVNLVLTGEEGSSIGKTAAPAITILRVQ